MMRVVFGSAVSYYYPLPVFSCFVFLTSHSGLFVFSLSDCSSIRKGFDQVKTLNEVEVVNCTLQSAILEHLESYDYSAFGKYSDSFFHNLLRLQPYSEIDKRKSSSIYTQWPIMTKRKQV
jgi:hypothetical protein